MTRLSARELRALFDYKDGSLYWRRDVGTRIKAGTLAGHRSARGYVYLAYGGVRMLAHRVVYAMHKGRVPRFLDHIDNDRSNNRIENLRPATADQNMHNRKRSSNNTSGVKGVSWAPHAKKWYAYCWSDNKQYNLGYYAKLPDAAAAVKAFRETHHGAYARA